MARVNTKEEKLTVIHPKFKELKVFCRVLEPVEAIDLFSRFQKFSQVVAVIHPVTGELVYNKEGKLETVTITNIPASEAIKVLEEVVEGWEGLEDNDDKPIPFHSSKLNLLFSKDLGFKEEIDDPKEEGKKKKINRSFGDYIQGELDKKLNKFADDEAENESVKKSKKSQ